MVTRKRQLTYNDYVEGVKRLKPKEQLNLVEIISAQLKGTIAKKKVRHSIMDLEGLGGDVWRGVDAQEYVRRERETWD